MRAVLVVMLGLAAVIGITSGSAATTSKPYTAVVSPGQVPGGSTGVAMQLVLTNNNTTPQSIGSANLKAQKNFTITGAVIQGGTGDLGATMFPTELLMLRNLDIAPNGGSLTVDLTVTTPCSDDVSPADEWEPTAKQSNNYSGPPGNDFFLVKAQSSLHTTIGGPGTPDKLKFSKQPADAEVAPATMQDVEVTVEDACGSVATSATGNVSLSLVQPTDTTFGGGGSLGGTTSVALSNGVATFSGLSVDTSGQGYALDASYNSLTKRSTTFSIYDFFGPCSTPPCGITDDTTEIEINMSTTDNVGLSLKAGSSATCQGLNVLGSAFTVVPPPGHTDYDIPIVLTINKRGLQGIGVSNIVVCKNEGPGTPLVQLDKCPKKGKINQACIVSQTASNAGDAEITILVNSTDPGGAGFG